MYNHTHNNTHQHIDEPTYTNLCMQVHTHPAELWDYSAISTTLSPGKNMFYHFILFLSSTLPLTLPPSLSPSLRFLAQQHVALPRLLYWNHRPHPVLWQKPCAFGGVIRSKCVCMCVWMWHISKWFCMCVFTWGSDGERMKKEKKKKEKHRRIYHSKKGKQLHAWDTRFPQNAN